MEKEQDVVIYLLNGMPLNEFKSWFILSMAGAVTYLLIRIIWFLSTKNGTGPEWSWRMFFIGVLKLMVTFIVSPWLILYFSDVMPLLMKFFIEIGDSEGPIGKLTMEINGASAFLIGFLIDFAYYRFTKKVKNGKKGLVGVITHTATG